MIADRLRRGEFEHRLQPLKALYYLVERRLGHRFFRRPPPPGPAPRLLNLGCGPLRYPGWVNADEYAFKRSLRQRRFAPDWRLDISRPWLCPAEHWDGIFTQHVLEHLHYSDVVAALQECLRTLKPGAWLRVSVPGVRQTMANYEAWPGAGPGPGGSFPHPALAVSFLTQMHGHVSAWDGDLMCALLRDLGFADVREVAHGEGSDPRLIMDQDVKRAESLYVEARKPQ